MAARYMYAKEVSHQGLNKYRVVKAPTRHELERKVSALQAQWDEQWRKIQEREAKQRNLAQERADKQRDLAEAESYAQSMTAQAERLQEMLDSILKRSLYPQPLQANILKNTSPFETPQPIYPQLWEAAREPLFSDETYHEKPSFFTKISRKKMEKFIAAAELRYEADYNEWKKRKEEVDRKNDALIEEYNRELAEWQQKKEEYEREQSVDNQKIEEMLANYRNGNKEAIEEYYATLLEQIELPFSYSKAVETEYQPEAKRLIVEQQLPIVDDLPKLKGVSYIKTRKEFKESYYTDAYLTKKYDQVIYQIVVQTLNYVFTVGKEYDYINNVVVNGKVSTVDKATGKDIEPCVLSISVDRNAFEDLNLEAIDPRAWFKSAKGVSAAAIANTTPVAPIITVSREDSRFIDAYEVADQLDDSVNLAAIDWKDFENLIREIFEKEFSSNGGEVKITQASRDGGVDAVAFDPDPIRGGKIVIQAKRYTNVVGVSAVRDLYGTVMNEGATKGILVTTSNYGNDAYKFAQGKPLTLMNGANLLYLLERHGYKAKIDLKEARQQQNN